MKRVIYPKTSKEVNDTTIGGLAGLMQLLDNIKFTAISPHSEKNRKQLLKSLKAVKQEGLSASANYPVEGKDVLEAYNFPEGTAKDIAGQALEFIGPETFLTGGGAAVARLASKGSKIAKLKNANKLSKILEGEKASKLLKATGSALENTGIEGLLKVSGKGLKKLGVSNKANPAKMMTNIFPKQMAEKARRKAIEKQTRKHLYLNPEESYETMSGKTQDISDFISKLRNEYGEKLSPGDDKTLARIANKVKKESQFDSDMLISSFADLPVSRSKIYNRAIKKSLPQGMYNNSIKENKTRKFKKLIVPSRNKTLPPPVPQQPIYMPLIPKRINGNKVKGAKKANKNIQASNKKMQDAYDLLIKKQKPVTVEEDITIPLFQAKSEKDALGSILSKRKRDAKPVSDIEAFRKAENDEIKDVLERLAGKDVSEKYKKSQRTYGLAAESEDIAKDMLASKSTANRRVPVNKAGLAANALEAMLNKLSTTINVANKPVKNLVQESIIAVDDMGLSNSSESQQRYSDPKYIKGTPENAAYRKELGLPALGRSPQSIEDMPEVEPLNLEAPSVFNQEDVNFAQEALQPQIEDEVLDTKLPRDSEKLINNPEVLKEKVKLYSPQAYQAVDDMLRNDPEGIKQALPKVSAMAPAAFERDTYNAVDGKIQDLPKFFTDLKHDEGLNSIEKAILAKKAYRGEKIL